MLTDKELEIEMENGAALDVGTVAWVGNDLSESEAEIELSNNTSLKGFILYGNIEEFEMPNDTMIEGVLLGYNIGEGDEGIKLSNRSIIRGLTIVLNQLGGIDLSNNSMIEGSVFVNRLGLVDVSNSGLIEFNDALVNQLIKDYNLLSYFFEVACEPVGNRVVKSFATRVY